MPEHNKVISLGEGSLFSLFSLNRYCRQKIWRLPPSYGILGCEVQLNEDYRILMTIVGIRLPEEDLCPILFHDATTFDTPQYERIKTMAPRSHRSGEGGEWDC